MKHKDKTLTLATSRLLQEDLRTIIARERASWKVVDSGLTPPTATSNPMAVIFIVDTTFRHLQDYTDRQKYAGGKYFRADLTIESSMESDSASHLAANLAPWARKYANAAHIKCRITRGDGFDNRYQVRGDSVCQGVHVLIDIPEATMEMAEKIRKVMNVSMATQATLNPH